jgi:formate/nitrite transporter FocA (FNT family)
LTKSKAKRKKEMKAGILGIFAAMFMIGIFIIFLTLIPVMILQIQTSFAISEDLAQVLLLILFTIGFIIVSYLGYELWT